MASTEAAEKIQPLPPAAEPEKIEAKAPEPEPEPEKAIPATEAPPPETKALSRDAAGPKDYFPVADVVLRFLLFAASLVAVVVMVTSNQTEAVPLPSVVPPVLVRVPAKFNHSPALIYLVAALSVSGLYSIITTLLSIYALLKPECTTKLVSHFVIIDVLLLGIVASATGAAGAVAYVGWKGNSHVGWNKICGTYDVFCKHIASSLAISLFASVVLAQLVLLSIYALSKKIPK